MIAQQDLIKLKKAKDAAAADAYAAKAAVYTAVYADAKAADAYAAAAAAYNTAYAAYTAAIENYIQLKGE